MNAPTANRFVPVGVLFDVEHAGPVIRIWCTACNKHEHLGDDSDNTVAAAKASHRCGERTSAWDCGTRGRRTSHMRDRS